MSTSTGKRRSSPVLEPAPSTKARKSSPLVTYYLVAYNALSALAWGYILLKLLVHLSGLQTISGTPTSAPTASSKLASAFSALPWERVPTVLSRNRVVGAQGAAAAFWRSGAVPAALRPLLARARTAYGVVGMETALVQSAAALEVLHALMGWVRSPVQTTAMQVASRLFTVWGVVECFDSARTSPLYASMVLAWSLTEVIRYAFYALSLLSREPYALLWLRYTTFYVLYPLGAGSEAFVNYATLPRSSPLPSLAAWVRGSVWTPFDYLRGVLFLVWWPALYVLYTYMMSQRRKVLGKGKGYKLGEKRKSL